MKQMKRDNTGIMATVLFICMTAVLVLAAETIADRFPKEEEKMEYGIPGEGKEIPEETVVSEPEDEVAEEVQPELVSVYPVEEWEERLANHSSDEFTGTDYEGPVNCIDKTVSYNVKYSYYSYIEESNIDLCVSVIQLEGDIPNLAKLNETLEQCALEETEFPMMIREEIIKENWDYVVESDSYVTYNDEKQISVVVRHAVTRCSVQEQNYLKSINIDLETGKVLHNNEILDLDGFGEEFARRLEEENDIPEMFEWCEDEHYEDMLNNREIILYYTPLGMEVGLNDMIMSGWVTITLQDYETYLVPM